jgi:hypothetical protein
MNAIATLGPSQEILRNVAHRVATEFVALAQELPADVFAAALCPNHLNATSVERRAA